MNWNLKTLSVATCATLMAGAFTPVALANESGQDELDGNNEEAMQDTQDKLQEAQTTLNEAKGMVDQMKADEDVQQALQEAEAVFLVPDYGRASFIVGGAGGEGVLLVNDGNGSFSPNDNPSQELNGWSQPMFYNMGAINVGAEAGVEAGQIAMLLMTEEAVDTFTQENNFSVNADAGLTVVDFSERAQATAGKGDIVMWSDTEGAYAGLAVNVENISWDDEENKAFYSRDVSPDRLMDGGITHDRNNPLNEAMPNTI